MAIDISFGTPTSSANVMVVRYNHILKLQLSWLCATIPVLWCIQEPRKSLSHQPLFSLVTSCYCEIRKVIFSLCPSVHSVYCSFTALCSFGCSVQCVMMRSQLLMINSLLFSCILFVFYEVKLILQSYCQIWILQSCFN